VPSLTRSMDGDYALVSGIGVAGVTGFLIGTAVADHYDTDLHMWSGGVSISLRWCNRFSGRYVR
jgi:hypothetical protein